MAGSVENAALVALLRRGKRPWQQYADLVEETGSAMSVLEDELAADSGAPTLFGGEQRPELEDAASQIAAWDAGGMRMVTVLDPDYPPNLRAVHDRPPLVFVAGRLAPGDARSVAVVGARSASERGTAAATAIAEQLVETGYTVVSGLAAGIDTAAHSAALAAKGRTVAVIGTGLRRVYPPQNAALQRRIATDFAVISQFWPDAPPSRRSFPMRNAVMSGFALATVVVEASQSSGSRMQARLALEHGRPVLLLQSLLAHEWAREFAGRPGAHVVGSAAEVTAVVERLTSTGTLVA
ncbi:MAG: DNA-protecting protein DprA [Actinomycetota bacterium]|nr:DNA-protecting protein DprA [Actinomycetota bacterium]